MDASGNKFLTREGLQARGINFCNYYLLRLERDDRFPKRIRLGHKTVVWDAAEVDGWIQSRLAERERRTSPSRNHDAAPAATLGACA